MSDMGDDFRYFRELSKKKRADNYEYSTNKLDELGIKYRDTGSWHYIIEHNGKTIDYYPSTGLWWDRKNKHQKRGIRKLLTYLGFDAKEVKKRPAIDIEPCDIPF